MNNSNWLDLKQDADTGIEAIRAHFEGTPTTRIGTTPIWSALPSRACSVFIAGGSAMTACRARSS